MVEAKRGEDILKTLEMAVKYKSFSLICRSFSIKEFLL